MPKKQMITYAVIIVATLILADRLKALPVINKLPTV